MKLTEDTVIALIQGRELKLKEIPALKHVPELEEKAEKWDRYYDPERWMHLEEQNKQLKEKLEKIAKEVNENIESFEQLNLRHQESYDDSGDTSYLSTMSRNQDIIDSLTPIKKILREEE